MSKNRVLRLITAVVFAASIIGVSGMVAMAQSDDPNCQTVQCRKDAATARNATAKYHDFQTALDDGFLQVSPCIEHPVLGAMGFHFLNPARLFDFAAIPAEPELLLYMPDSEGVMQLVAVEYSVPYIGQPPPILYDLPMQGPEDHGGGPAYERHAWIWRNNPSGLFQPFNPKLKCPAG